MGTRCPIYPRPSSALTPKPHSLWGRAPLSPEASAQPAHLCAPVSPASQVQTWAPAPRGRPSAWDVISTRPRCRWLTCGGITFGVTESVGPGEGAMPVPRPLPHGRFQPGAGGPSPRGPGLRVWSGTPGKVALSEPQLEIGCKIPAFFLASWEIRPR